MSGKLELNISSIWFNHVDEDITMYIGLSGSAIGIQLEKQDLQYMKHDIDKILKYLEESK